MLTPPLCKINCFANPNIWITSTFIIKSMWWWWWNVLLTYDLIVSPFCQHFFRPVCVNRINWQIIVLRRRKNVLCFLLLLFWRLCGLLVGTCAVAGYVLQTASLIYWFMFSLLKPWNPPFLISMSWKAEALTDFSPSKKKFLDRK